MLFGNENAVSSGTVRKHVHEIVRTVCFTRTACALNLDPIRREQSNLLITYQTSSTSSHASFSFCIPRRRIADEKKLIGQLLLVLEGKD